MTPDEHERETPVEGVSAIRPATSTTTPPPKISLPAPPRTPSGMHPVIQRFRGKLDSLLEGHVAQQFDELDARIDATTEALKTPIPPPETPAEAEEEKTPTSH